MTEHDIPTPQPAPLRNEKGMVMVFTLVVLVVVTLLGLAAVNTSVFELQVASNDQFIKMAFYNADGALYGTAKLVSHAVNRGDEVNSGVGSDAPGIDYVISATSFYRQVAGFDADNNSPEVDFNPGGINAQSDVKRIRQDHVAGGGAEFATGAEGTGALTVAIFYDVDAVGVSNRQTAKDLSAVYRKVVGVPGGL